MLWDVVDGLGTIIAVHSFAHRQPDSLAGLVDEVVCRCLESYFFFDPLNGEWILPGRWFGEGMDGDVWSSCRGVGGGCRSMIW